MWEHAQDPTAASSGMNIHRCHPTCGYHNPILWRPPNPIYHFNYIQRPHLGGFEVFGRRPASGWGAGGRAKRSVASLGGPASPEALLHTLAKEYCCKEVAQMALFQCIQVSKGTTPDHQRGGLGSGGRVLSGASPPNQTGPCPGVMWRLQNAICGSRGPLKQKKHEYGVKLRHKCFN